MRRRFTASKSLVVSMAFISILSTSLFRPPNAQARFCTGDRELIRYYLQSLARMASEYVGSIQEKIIYTQNSIISYSGNFFKLALWATYLESRSILMKLLVEASEPDSIMPTLPAFKSALGPSWNQVIAISKEDLKSNVNYKAIIEETLLKLGTRWSVCQAATTRRLESCKLLESLDPQQKSSCRETVARISILYAGRCSEQNIKTATQALGSGSEVVKLICKIVTERKSNLCVKLAEAIPTSLPLCLAITGKGESACKDPELSAEESKWCLSEYATFQVANRELSHAAWAKKNNSDYISNMAVKALIGGKDCYSIILQQFDQMILSNFNFGTKRWYQPPTMLF
jgi:hypothetical protein